MELPEKHGKSRGYSITVQRIASFIATYSNIEHHELNDMDESMVYKSDTLCQLAPVHKASHHYRVNDVISIDNVRH